MVDNLTRVQRRRNMRNIHSKHTSIEKIIRKQLRTAKIKFQGNAKGILGKPDFVIRKSNIVIFVDSCFWHSCPYHATYPKSNISYWIPKLRRNKERDKYVTKSLRNEGWQVIRIWEHSIRQDPQKCIHKVQQMVDSRS